MRTLFWTAVFLLDGERGGRSRPGYLLVARHYLGSAEDLEARLAEHAAGVGARLLWWVRRAGIGWTLARTWVGDRQRERQLKARGHSRHCPICTPPRRPGRCTR